MSFAEKPFDQLQRFRIHIKSIIKAGRLGFCQTIHPLIRHHHNNYILSKSISSAPKLIIIASSDHVQVASCWSLSSAHRFLTDSLSIIYSESPRRLPACLPTTASPFHRLYSPRSAEAALPGVCILGGG